jgi:nicotinamidase-related amidase
MSDHHPSALALLVVDMQNEAFNLGPYRRDEMISNVAVLLKACRDSGIPVVFVRHDAGPGTSLERGSPGWEIHASVGPLPGETIVDKQFNSAFRETDLEARLGSFGVDTLILVGWQTEYCIDTTCRVAFELGYRVILPEMTNSTFDNGPLSGEAIYRFFNERIFHDRFATVEPLGATLARIQGTG